MQGDAMRWERRGEDWDRRKDQVLEICRLAGETGSMKDKKKRVGGSFQCRGWKEADMGAKFALKTGYEIYR